MKVRDSMAPKTPKNVDSNRDDDGLKSLDKKTHISGTVDNCLNVQIAKIKAYILQSTIQLHAIRQHKNNAVYFTPGWQLTSK